jgi:hypothetical protein
MRAALALLFVALPLAGCSLIDDRACTSIGCEDGLSVQIEAPPAEAFTLQALVGGAVTATFECPGGGCAFAFLREVGAEEVTLRLTWAGGAREATVRPEYVAFQPNGPDCPPVCRQAVVQFAAA